MDNIQPSRVFGSYTIKQKIGIGGMASVFQAVHSETNEEVALKILHEHYADDPHIRKRLEHEARIVMRLNHPHIVSVLDYGEAENRPYLVMPYMEGGSLAQFFSKPRLVKHDTTLKLLTLLADGLDYAHRQEVVHRDLKLENILLSKSKLLAISDFGIAQSTHTTRITLTGQILGTPQYLAPENMDANGNLNYRADLYALAIMAYLMLTGYFPFTAKDPLNLAIKHRTEIAPPPSLVNQNLPMMLDPIFVRGLAKNPDERFASAQEFVEALDTAFSQATTVTTKIFINDLNPVPATQPALPREAILAADSRITKVLPPEVDAIPAVQPEAIPVKAKPSRRLIVAFLLLFLCAGSALVLSALNGSLFAESGIIAGDMQAESTAEASDSLVVEASSSGTERQSAEAFNRNRTAEPSPTASATGTSRPSSTPVSNNTSASRPTNTARPSNTATNRPTSTSRPSNTSLPTNTSRPLPTNTSKPAATSVPPTNVPPTNAPAPTSVPPSNVPPTNAPAPTTILDPILNPVNTLVPCIPIPLIKDC
jgi:serine/threonine protein kinase